MPPTFVVPYVSEEPKRERPFTPEMEKAAVLCLAEARRRKPRFLKGGTEEIEYIAKFQYPLWGIPWEDRCIVIDGMGLSSAVVSYDQMPNIIVFTEDLKESSTSFKLFKSALNKHEQTFRGPVSTKEEIAEAVIGEGSLLKFLSSIVKPDVSKKEISDDDAVLVPPKFAREEAENKAESLISKWRRLRSEVHALSYALDVLKEEIEHHKEKISREIEQVWSEYEERISEMKRRADRRIKQLIKEKEKETRKATRIHERRMRKIFKEEKNLQQKIERLEHSLREAKKRRRDQRRKHPKRSTASLDGRIESYKEKISDLSQKLRETSRLMKEAGREGEETFKMIEEKYLSMATKEMKKLEVLEESRNRETSEKNEEIGELEDKASTIGAQIKQLIEQKNNSMKKIEDKTLPWRIDETVLIGIPFYLVQYRSPRKTRVDVHPPVTAASHDGMIKKIQRTILSFNLEARIQLLLRPRSTALNDEIFAKLKRNLEANPASREGISQLGKSRNLLKFPGFKDEAARGMRELEAEGWVSAKEKDSVLSICAG